MKKIMSESISKKVIFHENQQFRQIWLWLLIILLTGIVWYSLIQQIIFKTPFGNRPAHYIILWILMIILGIGFPLLFCITKLTVKVNRNAIYIRFFPFHFRFRKISLTELKNYEVRTYKPLLNYGGWGIRYGFRGKAYNVSGNRGIQLEFQNGKRILIGSQKPEEFKKSIDFALGKSHD